MSVHLFMRLYTKQQKITNNAKTKKKVGNTFVAEAHKIGAM